jgi:hypothetical protein
MFELTIYEYEDTEVLGHFTTMTDALVALGLYAIDHGDAVGLHPHIFRIGSSADEPDPAAASFKAALIRAQQ